jgi:hypothetical protein
MRLVDDEMSANARSPELHRLLQSLARRSRSAAQRRRKFSSNLQ